MLLVEQFRYPRYARGDGGWLPKHVAGAADESEDRVEIAHRELIGEVGIYIDEIVHLMDCYPSPGACTERIAPYLGHLGHGKRVAPGGGVDAHEDIRLVEWPFQDTWHMVKSIQVRDAMTGIAFQFLALRRMKGES